MERWGYITLIAVIVLVAIFGYVLFNNADDKANHKDCTTYPDSERDLCCVNNPPSVFVATCPGTWKFNSTSEQCYYICNEDRQFCTADVKECPDGSYVGRDGNNNCEFKPCP